MPDENTVPIAQSLIMGLQVFIYVFILIEYYRNFGVESLKSPHNNEAVE